MNNYGQKDIPDIVIYIGDIEYNISKYYKNYYASYETNNKSCWSIDSDVIPEGLKELLPYGVDKIVITETHRLMTGEDTVHIYNLDKPNVCLTETLTYGADLPFQYNIMITGSITKE